MSEVKIGDRAVFRYLCPTGTVIERKGQVTGQRSDDVFLFLPDSRLCDTDFPVLRENLRVLPSDPPASLWLHRTEIGERYVCHQVHPDLKPADCPDCTLFVEAEGGGRP
jgi:hypothetical protein